MDELSLEKYRKTLLKERARIREELEGVEREISYDDTRSGQSELADYDNHPGDAGTDTFDKERDVAVADSLRDTIGTIDEALGQMDRGTYGECDRCGRQIGKGRLDAVPWAILCVQCQDIVEGR